ncbi:LuxR C-terminal-related transcriptional regulator [Stieleria sp. JC731]|uniref:LuxR C-terminal-related transcriptional regulator n=2 Tax=Pirellulaceae TaxID=2691357 RepID=UPI001E40ED43|nr:LuxR C-terminal-related transcriptional regulator [Stieleria sp. JC731]MCC9604070.1 LuxR C-terminal-related transcriptional regulator [Stieleria sp. JC731]
MMNHHESSMGYPPTPLAQVRPVVFAASKDSAWLSRVGQAASAEGFRFQTSPSITSLVNQAASTEEIACIFLDYDPRIQQWSSIEQLLFEKNVAAPVALVLDENSGMSASEAVARIAHVVAFNSMETHEIVDSIRDAVALSSLVSHQFDVLRCHRLYQTLPERQRKIVDFVVEGAPNKQIATKLKVSVKTIERERQKAYRHLNVRSTAEMTRVVILGGLHDVIFPVARARNGFVDRRIDQRSIEHTKSSGISPTASMAPPMNSPSMPTNTYGSI